MSTATNGETEKKRRRHNDGFLPNTLQALGTTEVTGGSNGAEPHGLDFEHSSRENFVEQPNRGNSCPGKILARLKQFELEHFSYEREQQQLLQSLLEVSKQREAKLRQVILELEQEIQSLMSGNAE